MLAKNLTEIANAAKRIATRISEIRLPNTFTEHLAEMTSQLLSRVRRYKSTMGAFQSLSPMLRTAYWSVKKKEEHVLTEEEAAFAGTAIGQQTTTPRQPAASSRDASFF